MNQQGRNMIKASELMLENLNDMMSALEKSVIEKTKHLSAKEAELFAIQFEKSNLLELANKIRQNYKDLEK